MGEDQHKAVKIEQFSNQLKMTKNRQKLTLIDQIEIDNNRLKMTQKSTKIG